MAWPVACSYFPSVTHIIHLPVRSLKLEVLSCLQMCRWVCSRGFCVNTMRSCCASFHARPCSVTVHICYTYGTMCCCFVSHHAPKKQCRAAGVSGDWRSIQSRVFCLSFLIWHGVFYWQRRELEAELSTQSAHLGFCSKLF